MLFNSHLFLLGFLPCAIIGYNLTERRLWLRVPVLVLFSLLFYSWWNPRFVLLLVASILLNWLSARAFVSTRNRAIITGAIVFDLAVLGIFKYTNFFLQNATALTGIPFQPLGIVLPLGISFFTFHHIMYLADLRRGRAPLAPFDCYALYICFFPQAIAGPIARWSEVGNQFGQRIFAPGWEHRWALGITFILLGLIQKVALGDPIGKILDPIYAAAASGPVTDGGAWLAPGFALQIFFDFSGYSDIAIGVALLFGVQLPYNFNAPFQASSILEFWQRWHMTLSRFLRDYVFLRLADWRIAGRRHTVPQYVMAFVLTMTLCGLWHGAGWNYIIWGTLQGVAMVFALGWRRAVGSPPRLAGCIATILFFVLTVVIFRAETFSAVWHIYSGFGVLPGTKLLRDSWVIGVAAVLAVSLPSSQSLCTRLTQRPLPLMPAVLGLIGLAILVQLGSNESYDFIYFQF
jgi:alginate O-acetyltransferase complex protein AlgI